VAPFTLLPGSLDEPLLLSRDGDARLHALSNVCTHRGAILCESPARLDEIRCPYHARRFRLDGRMRFAPGFENAAGFPAGDCDLPRLPLREWGPLRFVSLDPAQGFDDWLAPVRDRCGWLPLDAFRFDPSRSRDYHFDGSWILYVENYLDSLHIPFVHPGLNRTLDFKRYTTEHFAGGSLQLAIAADDETAFEVPEGWPDHGLRVAAWYFWLFPNLMLNLYPWGLSLNLVEPLGTQRTRVRFCSVVWRPALLDAGAGGDLDTVEQEDEAMVLSVSRGLRSRLYRGGRYAPVHEAACHQFHGLLLDALEGEAASP
jgi:choline monooxygenase